MAPSARVREVHNWSSRPYWPQGVARPAETEAVPEGFDWDMWLGPAPSRPYNSAYLPFVWRGWYDFGCGSFGDMGCYSFAGVFKILGLTPPTVVEASSSEPFEETYPKASIVHLDFPADGDRGPVHMAWYDGGLMPPVRRDSFPSRAPLREAEEGIMYVGDKGFILAGFNGDIRACIRSRRPTSRRNPARKVATSGMTRTSRPGHQRHQSRARRR